jgi:hypothetical protein
MQLIKDRPLRRAARAVWAALVVTCSTGSQGAAAPLNAPRREDPTLMIRSEARCINSRGIPIKEVPDSQVKVACLRDPQVQKFCNQDGQHARLQAFRDWERQLIEFKDRCASVGGVFSFGMPGFEEPSDESFCSLAQPEISYNSFETPLCNFVSRCPPVPVTCLRPEDALMPMGRRVMLPGVPQPIAISH